MRDLPILFNDAMVRATLDGWKTQTRRPVKRENPPEPGMQWAECLCHEIDPSDTPCVVCDHRFGASPFGGAGSRLWVREAFQIVTGREPGDRGAVIRYRDTSLQSVTMPADKPMPLGLTWDRWRPSIHMPRWASRITLPVVRVWVERVQDITEEGARAEGITEPAPVHGKWVNPREVGGGHWSYRKPFADLWESLYPGSWDRNEWVWACEFGDPEVRNA